MATSNPFKAAYPAGTARTKPAPVQFPARHSSKGAAKQRILSHASHAEQQAIRNATNDSDDASVAADDTDVINAPVLGMGAADDDAPVAVSDEEEDDDDDDGVGPSDDELNNPGHSDAEEAADENTTTAALFEEEESEAQPPPTKKPRVKKIAAKATPKPKAPPKAAAAPKQPKAPPKPRAAPKSKATTTTAAAASQPVVTTTTAPKPPKAAPAPKTRVISKLDAIQAPPPTTTTTSTALTIAHVDTSTMRADVDPDMLFLITQKCFWNRRRVYWEIVALRDYSCTYDTLIKKVDERGNKIGIDYQNKLTARYCVCMKLLDPPNFKLPTKEAELAALKEFEDEVEENPDIITLLQAELDKANRNYPVINKIKNIEHKNENGGVSRSKKSRSAEEISNDDEDHGGVADTNGGKVIQNSATIARRKKLVASLGLQHTKGRKKNISASDVITMFANMQALHDRTSHDMFKMFERLMNGTQNPSPASSKPSIGGEDDHTSDQDIAEE
jgi:hypothetical protein